MLPRLISNGDILGEMGLFSRIGQTSGGTQVDAKKRSVFWQLCLTRPMMADGTVCIQDSLKTKLIREFTVFWICDLLVVAPILRSPSLVLRCGFSLAFSGILCVCRFLLTWCAMTIPRVRDDNCHHDNSTCAAIVFATNGCNP
jgi:hypothetical protein